MTAAPKRVGVFPKEKLKTYRRLLKALSQAFSVSFAGSTKDLSEYGVRRGKSR